MEDVPQQIPGANQSQLRKHRMEKFFMLMRVTAAQTDTWDGSEETR